MDTNPIDPQSLLRVKTLTAGPLLHLLLALEGMEPPELHPARAWPVLRRFLALPSESGQDVYSFQASWASEMGEAPVLFCTFARQLTDEAGDRGEPLTRSIQLEFSYEIARTKDLDACEVWSDRFRTVEQFAAYIERLPHFQMMQQETPVFCEIFAEDMDEGDGNAPEGGRD